MRKNILTIAAAAIITLSAAGCGNSASDQTVTLDLDKVSGTELVSETKKGEYSGKLGDVKVTIGDAKLIEYMDDQVAVVSFDYKNNSKKDMPFTGALKAEAYQDDGKLIPTVITDVEGISMMPLTETVPKGESITVQKAYILRDTETPLVVEVKKIESEIVLPDGLVKVFEF